MKISRSKRFQALVVVLIMLLTIFIPLTPLGGQNYANASTAKKRAKIDFNGDGKADIFKIWNDGGGFTTDVHLSAGNTFNIGRWATKQGGYSDNMKWFLGDFNGNGKTDLVKLWNDEGLFTADVHLSTGSAFNIGRWATKQGSYSDDMKWFVGDFNGDGKTDLMKVWNHDGTMYSDVHISTGSSFVMQRWASAQGGMWEDMEWVVGDFNGDGKDDLMKYWNDGGMFTADVHVSTNGSFVMHRWATRQGAFGKDQHWTTGDFNGDGKLDLVKIWNDGGMFSTDVHLSTGSAFNMARWATKQGSYGDVMKWAVGDFNGDGRDDLVKVWNVNGQMYSDVHTSTGSAFNIARWATNQGAMFDGILWSIGDFNGDGKDDLIKVWNHDGQMYSDVHISTGSAFQMNRWASAQGGFWDTQKWPKQGFFFDITKFFQRELGFDQRKHDITTMFPNFLMRNITSAELNHWYYSGQTIEQIATNIINSQEGIRKAGIITLYFKYFARIPSMSELNHWYNASASLPDIEENFYNSQEHRRFIIGNTYRLYIGREATSTELNNHAGSKFNLKYIIDTILKTQERKNVRELPERREFEISFYFNYFLGRDPSESDIHHYMSTDKRTIDSLANLLKNCKEREDKVRELVKQTGRSLSYINTDRIRMSETSMDEMPIYIEDFIYKLDASLALAWQNAFSGWSYNYQIRMQQKAQHEADFNRRMNEHMALNSLQMQRMKAFSDKLYAETRAKSEAFWAENRRIVMQNYARHVVMNEVYRQELGLSSETNLNLNFGTNSKGDLYVTSVNNNPVSMTVTYETQPPSHLFSKHGGVLMASSAPVSVHYSSTYHDPLREWVSSNVSLKIKIPTGGYVKLKPSYKNADGSYRNVPRLDIVEIGGTGGVKLDAGILSLDLGGELKIVQSKPVSADTYTKVKVGIEKLGAYNFELRTSRAFDGIDKISIDHTFGLLGGHANLNFTSVFFRNQHLYNQQKVDTYFKIPLIEGIHFRTGKGLVIDYETKAR